MLYLFNANSLLEFLKINHLCKNYIFKFKKKKRLMSKKIKK